VTDADRILCRLTQEPLREDELTSFVTTSASGGIVLFSGVVRDHHRGRSVTGIEYSAAPELALAKLRQVCEEVLAAGDVQRVAVVHRVGDLAVGDASVMVAASAAHRDAAFAAGRRLIDRIKEIVPIWKREHFADGTSSWVPGHAVGEEERTAGDGVPPADPPGPPPL
jgi:molybdopterin synthase catalytic subunit